MRITEEQKKEMRRLNVSMNIKEVSRQMEIPYSTVLYHLSERIRKSCSRRNLKYQKNHPPVRDDRYREYQRIYHNKRYWRLKTEKEVEKDGI